jgi:uncharacterized protein (DUF1800 family)
MSADAVRWLHRRAGFGLPIDQLRVAEASGADAELDRLLNDGPVGDPWRNDSLPLDPRDRPSKRYAIGTWLQAMIASERPLVERTAWMWHGHFVSGLDKVRVARYMVDQIRLFRSEGLGSTRDLLRSMAIDRAMLVYLDLRTSTGGDPNENFARELLELFTLGEGEYTEDDVRAGAVALTGWTVDREGEVRFVPRRHDDSAQPFLGMEGVHDLDTVLDAVMRHDACAPFLAAVVADAFLGTSEHAIVDPLAADFVRSGHDLRVLVGATLRAGLAGATAPVLLAPVPWWVNAVRVTGASPDLRRAAAELRTAGQVPMVPPNVAGWPSGTAWLAASSLVARANLAAAVAATIPDGEVRTAAGGSDLDALADVLGLPRGGFSDPSADSLLAAPPGTDRLAVALLTPEFLVV